MGEIKLTMNGWEVRGKEGATILETASEAGIRIPTLCHSPDLRPAGGCRICVVEVEGYPRLVASCHTPISQGMVIQTHSAKVVGARKAILELSGRTQRPLRDRRGGQGL